MESAHSDPREKPLEQSAVARLNKLVQILDTNDRLRDFESNRRYNWLTRIDQHVKEYFQLCC